MAYDFLEHTGDVRMEVSGNTPEELFTEALAGMMAFMGPHIARDNDAEAEQKISVTASDRAALLVDFLNEALRLAQEHKEFYTKTAFSRLDETALEADLYGRLVEQFDDEIKAVTYHEAEVSRTPDGKWRAKIIFDI